MDALEVARTVFAAEAGAVSALAQHADDRFSQAVRAIVGCTGRVVLFGVGKSGHIGRRVAATMASLGIPSFFVHAGEGHHGDIGSVTADDVVIIISYGGESEEVLTMLPVLRQIGTLLVSITGRPDSTVARAVEIVLDTGPHTGQGAVGWTHLSSLAASMAMGDALANSAAASRGLTRQDLARYHPGGSYGKELRKAGLV